MPTQRQAGAIITGAGSAEGIGFAAARHLGADGRRVVVTSTTDRIFERVEELRAAGIDAEGVVADLTDQAGADAVVARASASFGGVEVLVNNAGMTAVSASYPSGAIDVLSLDDWHASLDRNLTTSFLMTRAVVGVMQAAGYGRIVNVSSVSGPVAAYAGDVADPAAKAGVRTGAEDGRGHTRRPVGHRRRGRTRGRVPRRRGRVVHHGSTRHG